MKYNININQERISKIAPDLDIYDAAILDFLIHFCGSDNKKIDRMIFKEDGIDYNYTWVNQSFVIEEMPLLQFKQTDSISKRIKKIKESGFVKTITMSRGGGKKIYVRLTEKVDLLQFDRSQSVITDNQTDVDLKDNQFKLKYHNINNHNIKDNITPSNEDESDNPIFNQNKQDIISLFDKNLIKPAEDGVWDYRWAVKGAKSRPHLFFIAAYWKQKEFRFDNKIEAEGELKRITKVARLYCDKYPIEKFKEMLEWIDLDSREKGGYTWTIETIDKKLGDFNSQSNKQPEISKYL